MHSSNYTVFELKHFLSPSLLQKHIQTHITKETEAGISIFDDRCRVLLKSLTFKSAGSSRIDLHCSKWGLDSKGEKQRSSMLLT